jgi:hypothetical protein
LTSRPLRRFPVENDGGGDRRERRAIGIEPVAAHHRKTLSVNLRLTVGVVISVKIDGTIRND